MKSFASLVRTWAVAGICVGFAAAASVAAGPQQKPATGPFATKAKVEVKTGDKVVPLKREEQIAFMFVAAINNLEDDCTRSAAEPCTLEALVRGPKAKDPNWPMGKLKFDPTTTDPNYTYKVVREDRQWEVWANPRKPGLGGFYVKHGFHGGTWYNSAGPATEKDTRLDKTSIDGDLFQEQ
jgi:hypothetical protein